MSNGAADAAELIAELGEKYVWWVQPDGAPLSPERIVAQAMNLGTYEDIRRLEAALGPHRLAQVMAHAEPGWFSRRSWEFWRGRLGHSGLIAEEPPRRSFHGDD